MPQNLQSKTRVAMHDIKEKKNVACVSTSVAFTTEINVGSQSNDTVEITIEDPCDLENVNKRVICKLATTQTFASHAFITPLASTLTTKSKLEETLFRKIKRLKDTVSRLKTCNQAATSIIKVNWAMIKASYIKDNNLNPNAYTYRRFCLCKRPGFIGFIGNVTLFGSCEHSFISTTETSSTSTFPI
ncbi:Protein of unknown function [Cotesia congregata]|uniref:Uncharacterized protein n=1 Tax=Cotesia congregata TaxID=51543 RepID=A0A8J2EJB1_COTCN|nr:Protein of unknown function [Cotesia congregata]